MIFATYILVIYGSLINFKFMLISRNWIQKYFKDEIPDAQKIADLLTMHIFEIESVEEKGDDTVMDVKVLPDRAAYALCHKGVANELGVLINQQAGERALIMNITGSSPVSRNLKINIQNENLCNRYMGRVVENVLVGESPEWLKKSLELVGQRSINTIVDLTNFMMLDIGQPMHTFDADKVKGDIQVRLAKVGEKITILDGTEITLNETNLVIADDEGPLAIAGVKGGKRAEIFADTKNIIIESANFDSVSVRKTSVSTGIKNDSSKRFENAISPIKAEEAMNYISSLILELNPNARFGPIIDSYPKPISENTFNVSLLYINDRLGYEVSSSEIIDILNKCDIKTEVSGDSLKIHTPLYRRDINIPQDIVDEIGRVKGYEDLKGTSPILGATAEINKNSYYQSKIKSVLKEKGFSEIYTHSLIDHGEVKLANPLNIERGVLRNNLTENVKEKLAHNIKYTDALGLSEIKIFEIGKVFKNSGENFNLAISIENIKNPKGWNFETVVKELLTGIMTEIGVKSESFLSKLIIKENIAELDLDTIIADLPEPQINLPEEKSVIIKYEPISPYPFSVRDIAVFVPGEAIDENKNNVLDIIKNNGTDLLVRTTLFDVFTKSKDGEPARTSYAYRLVFQAKDRTLIDNDTNPIMTKITVEMNSKEGWQVR